LIPTEGWADMTQLVLEEIIITHKAPIFHQMPRPSLWSIWTRTISKNWNPNLWCKVEWNIPLPVVHI